MRIGIYSRSPSEATKDPAEQELIEQGVYDTETNEVVRGNLPDLPERLEDKIDEPVEQADPDQIGVAIAALNNSLNTVVFPVDEVSGTVRRRSDSG